MHRQIVRTAVAALMALAAGQALAGSVVDRAALLRDTEILSSDAFEGRKPGTPGEDKAVAYIADRLAAAGVKPGAKGSWFQDVPLVTMTADRAAANLAVVDGRGTAVNLAYGTDVVLWTKRQVAKVELAKSGVVFVGYGINAPERGWNDYAGLDVRGKTVVILVNDPDWRNKPGDGPFEGRAMTYYGRWTYKFEEAARQGAAAALIVHDTEPAAYPWTTVTSSWTGPQIDTDRASRGLDRAAVEGWITREAAGKLLAAAGRDYATLEVAARQTGFSAVPLGLSASAAFGNGIVRSLSKNVVGILPGTTAASEYVLYTAHWDHLGRCPADSTGDDICNGALDNATGIAGLINIATAFAKAGPTARSVLFVAVTAEESGLLGSQYYAENPVYPLAKTVGGVNMDGLNILGPTNDIVVIGAGKSELEDGLARHAASQKRVLRPESNPERGSYYRSDHFSLAKFGVPMLSAGSGDDIRGKGSAFGLALSEDYIAKRYHQPSDEYDPNWNWDGAIEDLDLYYDIGRELATGDTWPNWRPTAEFRAIRDASRGTK